MTSRFATLLRLALLLGGALAATPAAPTVTLDNATVVGYTNNSVTSFMGIPFAEPPYVLSPILRVPLAHIWNCSSLGNLRLRLPKPITSYNGTINATQPATQCIQLNTTINLDLPGELLQDMTAYLEHAAATSSVPQSENCAYTCYRCTEASYLHSDQVLRSTFRCLRVPRLKRSCPCLP